MTNRERLNYLEIDSIGIMDTNLRRKVKYSDCVCAMDAFTNEEIRPEECDHRCGDCIQRWMDSEYDGRW